MVMSQTEEIEKLVEVLTDQTVLGRTHLLIWQGLNKDLVSNQTAFKTAPTFFATTVKAHAESTLLCLSKIYDKHPAGISLNRLIEIARNDSEQLSYPHDFLSSLDNWSKETARRDDQIKALIDYRNQELAHLDKRVFLNHATPSYEGKLTFDFVSQLYDDAYSLINTVSKQFLFIGSNEMEWANARDYKNVIRYLADEASPGDNS